MARGKEKLVVSMILALISFSASPAFARSISLKNTGIALWIFIIIGAVIVLLQLIPAAILFFSFVGTSSSMLFRRKKTAEEVVAVEEKNLVLPGYEPARVKK